MSQWDIQVVGFGCGVSISHRLRVVSAPGSFQRRLLFLLALYDFLTDSLFSFHSISSESETLGFFFFKLGHVTLYTHTHTEIYHCVFSHLSFFFPKYYKHRRRVLILNGHWLKFGIFFVCMWSRNLLTNRPSDLNLFSVLFFFFASFSTYLTHRHPHRLKCIQISTLMYRRRISPSSRNSISFF